MKTDWTPIREQLVALLQGGNAHVDFEGAVADVPPELRGKRPDGHPHSPWELLEHMRIAQWDILEFSRNPNHVSPKWPAGYWPKSPEPQSPGAWNHSLQQFRDDLAQIVELISNPDSDLGQKFPWGQGQTLLREALLVADHNAYHLGQLVLVRRLLGNWE